MKKIPKKPTYMLCKLRKKTIDDLNEVALYGATLSDVIDELILVNVDQSTFSSN